MQKKKLYIYIFVICFRLRIYKKKLYYHYSVSDKIISKEQTNR